MTDKPRRIGMGMKPRVEEEKLPTTEGQEVPASDDVKEASAVTVEGGDLAGVVTEIPAAEDEKESIVALDDGILPTEPLPVVPLTAFTALAETLKASETASGAEPLQNLDPAYDDSELDALAEKMLPEMMEGLPKPLHDPQKQYFVGTDFSDGPDKTVVAVIQAGDSETPDKLVGIFDLQMGQLANGEFRTTVCIREGYYEGVKQQAAADNQTLEEWLSLQLNTRLEEWYFAQPQR